MKKRNFAFVTGCGRSGTTAFAYLLNRHPQIVMGAERFKSFIKQERISAFGPHLFEERRFFDFKPDDTNATPDASKALRFHYDLAQSKYSSATVFGDKIPALSSELAAIAAAFPGAKILIVVRDVFEVANSWKRLGLGGRSKFFAGKTARHGVKAWNAALTHADVALESGGAPFIVRYEDLFSGDYDFRPMMDYIGVSSLDEFIDCYGAYAARAQLLAQRETVLDGDDRTYIAQNADLALFRKIASFAR